MDKKGIIFLSIFLLVMVVISAGCINSEGMGEESEDSLEDNQEENENDESDIQSSLIDKDVQIFPESMKKTP
ncbi:hypothetical protein JCM15415_18560 [Methanobacterium movens]